MGLPHQGAMGKDYPSGAGETSQGGTMRSTNHGALKRQRLACAASPKSVRRHPIVWFSRESTIVSKVMRLAFLLAVAAASRETAIAQTVVTDSSWLATNTAPAATWNTDPSFDTTGWINASVNVPACANGADCIWYDGQFSATQFAWLRKTFTISSPVSSAVLVG